MSTITSSTEESGEETITSRAVAVLLELLSDRATAASMTVIAALILIAIFAPVIAPYKPTAQFNAPPGQFTPLPPMSHGSEGRLFLLGTDPLGRDLLTRLIFGTRPMLLIVTGTVGLSALLGVPAGMAAAYYGGLIDEVIMRLMDVFISFPAIVAAIMLLGVLGTEGFSVFGVTFPHILTLIVAVGIIWAPRFARIMRGAVMTEVREDYVETLRIAGASDRHIIFNQIGVNVTGPMIVQATLSMAFAVLVSAALSFIGVGVQPPHASWGRMLALSRDYLISGEWWITGLPGLAILVTSLAFNIVGDSINDVIDPNYQGDDQQLER
ncbi:MAG: ABC transporter permease [Salinigranum sp.]